MAMTKERRKIIVKTINRMTTEEKEKMFFNVQDLLKSKNRPKDANLIYTEKLVDDMYAELPEIREILASIVMIGQTDMTTRALQDAGCLRGKNEES